MRTRSRFAAKLVGALGALALMIGLVGSANAAEVDVSFVIQEGSVINIGPTAFPLWDEANPTSAGVEGVYDDVTGEFNGTLVIPQRAATQRVDDPPLPGNVNVIVTTEAGPVTGTIDPATGEVDTTVDVTTTILFIDLIPDANPGTPVALNVECEIGPITLELSSTPDGVPYDPTAAEPGFTVTGEGFTVNPPTCTSSTPNNPLLPTVQDGFEEALGMDPANPQPTTDTDALVEFLAGDLTPAVAPTTTTTVAPPTTARPAPVVTATPRITG